MYSTINDAIIKKKLEALPLNLKKDVLNYIEFLLYKQTQLSKNKPEKFSFTWEGGLSELNTEFTSSKLKR